MVLLGEWELTGETDGFGENPQERHIIHHKTYMTWSGTELGPALWKTGNQLRYLWNGLRRQH
jgi:hypothetical protein